MQIIKHKTAILVICLLVFILASGVVYASSPQQQAITVAKELFNDEAKEFCAEVWDTLGFNSPEEVKEAYLGNPIQVFMLEDGVSVNKPLINQEIATPIYLFPIYANERCITEMEVKLRGGDWVLGRVGGHKAAYLNELAHTNKVELEDLKLIRFGPFTAFMTVKDGKEIGATYQKEAKDFNLTEENILEFKEKVKTYTDAEAINDDEAVIIEGQSYDPVYSFKQNDSITERLGRYIHYLIN